MIIDNPEICMEHRMEHEKNTAEYENKRPFTQHSFHPRLSGVRRLIYHLAASGSLRVIYLFSQCSQRPCGGISQIPIHRRGTEFTAIGVYLSIKNFLLCVLSEPEVSFFLGETITPSYSLRVPFGFAQGMVDTPTPYRTAAPWFAKSPRGLLPSPHSGVDL